MLKERYLPYLLLQDNVYILPFIRIVFDIDERNYFDLKIDIDSMLIGRALHVFVSFLK